MVRSTVHGDYRARVRTTVTLEPDVAAEVEAVRRREGLGISEVVNRLIRAGMVREKPAYRYVDRSTALGLKVDITNIGEVLDLLDTVDHEG